MSNERSKFRVWDTEEKSWVGPDDTYYECEEAPVRDFWDSVIYFGEADMHLYGGTRFVVEQCTGLQDKNGRLIWEADVVRQHEYCPVADADVDHTWPVEWWIYGWSPFVFWLSDAGAVPCIENRGRKGVDCHCHAHLENCEVIGNIHEHAELLCTEGGGD